MRPIVILREALRIASHVSWIKPRQRRTQKNHIVRWVSLRSTHPTLGFLGFLEVALIISCLSAPLASQASASLPDKLEMVYTIKYGSVTAGNSTRRLERQGDGSYRYILHTQPAGMARALTSVEWFEEGTFRVVKNQVRPLTYLKYRTGSSKSHRHSASVDWDRKQILYSSGTTVALPEYYQDQGSLVFALMLDPPTDAQVHSIQLNSGKKLSAYDYRFLRREEIDTPLGHYKTLVIQWSPHTPGEDNDIFTAWLAIDQNHVPVKIVTQEKDKTVTLQLQSIKGKE